MLKWDGMRLLLRNAARTGLGGWGGGGVGSNNAKHKAEDYTLILIMSFNKGVNFIQ